MESDLPPDVATRLKLLADSERAARPLGSMPMDRDASRALQEIEQHARAMLPIGGSAREAGSLNSAFAAVQELEAQQKRLDATIMLGTSPMHLMLEQNRKARAREDEKLALARRLADSSEQVLIESRNREQVARDEAVVAKADAAAARLEAKAARKERFRLAVFAIVVALLALTFQLFPR